MEWHEYLITTGIPTIAIIWVGYILKEQIKSQTSIIEKYKGLVEATSPDKIISLHNQEVEVLKRLANNNIDNLRTQISEMANYVSQDLLRDERAAKSIGEPDLMNIDAMVNKFMPNAKVAIDIMVTYYREQAAASAK
jgi:hypothetical protein